MKSKEQLLVDVYELAKETVPMPEILDFSLEMGIKLADIYSADKEIIKIAMALMDLKIKDAKEKGDITLYTNLAVEFTKDYIKDYDLSNENCSVEIEDTDNITQIHVTLDNNLKETYTFYVEKEEDVPVFKEFSNDPKTIQAKLPHLEIYVGMVCLFVIVVLFKCIVLGFKKRK